MRLTSTRLLWIVLMVSFALGKHRSPIRKDATKQTLERCRGKKPLTEKKVAHFLATEFESTETESCYQQAISDWDHLTDLDNPEKEKAAEDLAIEGANLDKKYWKEYFHRVDPNKCKDVSLARQIVKLSVLGNSALNDADLRRLTSIISNMTKIYSTAKVPSYETRNMTGNRIEYLTLDSDLITIMGESDDYDKLKYYWKAWRDATGGKLKGLFYDYVTLSNKAAKLNGFSDKGDMWRDEYEDCNFQGTVKNLWEEVKKLYDELQEYVLNRLREKYSTHIEDGETLIPAHILGNMWAQNWMNIAPYVLPFPLEEQVNVTRLLHEKDFTPLKMFETADAFYKSLGLESNEMCYNTTAGAMIEKPKDGRSVLCHASAWDFCNGKDFRIKMCTEVNFENFVIIHHEMGHIQYYQLYKHQPYAFRSGANPGFHEAIGDTIALSVTTPKHLARIRLIEQLDDNSKSDLNALMFVALERVAFLPYGYLLDKWRWDIFRRKVDVEQWNDHYWMYRESIQKVSAPVERHDESDFDPAAKFHVVADSQYISYFVAHILQFQFHKALCIAAQEYVPGDPHKPLHQCDIYESKAAGHLLRQGLSLGASVHWSEVLEKITGTKKLSGDAILEYFEPLLDFLVEKNNEYAANQKK